MHAVRPPSESEISGEKVAGDHGIPQLNFYGLTSHQSVEGRISQNIQHINPVVQKYKSVN